MDIYFRFRIVLIPSMKIDIYRYIYSFHMPLFMAISGFCCRFQDVSILVTLKKNTLALLLPFISWTVIRSFTGGAGIIQTLLDPDKGLWFLWVLYWIKIVFSITISCCAQKKVGLFYGVSLSFLILFVCWGFFKDLFGISLIFTHFFYFTLGYLIKKKDFLHKYPIGGIILFFCWIILGWFWMRNQAPSFFIGCSSIVSKSSMYVWHYLSAISGTIGWISLFHYVFHTNKTWAAYVGRNTLAIYAIHFFLIAPICNLYRDVLITLMGRGVVEDCMCILLSLVTILVLSLIIHKLLSIEKHVSLILFGRQ